MNDPKCKRFFRHCEEFSLCVNIGEKGYVIAEHPNERFTIFYYGIYGSGKFGRMFESEYITLDAKSKELVDVQDYVNSEVVFQSSEDFYLIGFNTPDKNIKWSARLVDNSEIEITENYKKSFLICLDGNVIVNGKKFKRYDYAPICYEKKYNIQLEENSVSAIFSQL